MKYYITTTVFSLFIKLGLTQNLNLDYKGAIKVYNQTSYEVFDKTIHTNDSTGNYLYYHNADLQILHPTVAYQCKTKKNNFREFELTGFSVANNVTSGEFKNDSNNYNVLVAGNNVLSSYFSIRYEYIVNFNKNKDKKLVPSIGFGINPYCRNLKNEPKVSTMFQTRESDFGFKAFACPRVTYYFSPKFFLDVNAPINILDCNINSAKDSNPAIPVNQRKVSTLDFNMFHNMANLRVGIGFKI